MIEAKPWRMSAALLLAFILFLSACAAAGPGRRPDFPKGVMVGRIDGPGGEYLAKTLRSRTSGEAVAYLGGEVVFNEKVVDERETVPVSVAAGEAQTLYKPDPFTSRLWMVRETPTANENQTFDFQRLTGEMIFNWRLTDEGGATIDSGCSAVDLNRTFGGFLAARKVAPGPGNPARLAEEARQLLAEEMARVLALDLGREPSPSEIETAPDEWSRRAALLARQGDWEGAKALWLEALNLNPNFSPALYNLGLYHERRHEPETALEFFQKAFVTNASPLHRAALTRLNQGFALDPQMLRICP